MSTAPLPQAVVMGHEILDVVRERGGRCALGELRLEAERRFGPGAVYGNCHGDRFDLDGVVEFLRAVSKLGGEGDEIALGPIRGCSGH